MPSRSLPLIVPCHVRDLDTGALSRKIEYYREVTKRIRSAEVDVVLNLTAGMGGGMVFGSSESPLPLNDTLTDMVGAKERLLHIEQCNPEICTLDCGTMNFADEGLIEDPVLIRLCRGVLGGVPNDLQTLMAMVSNIPGHWNISAFSLGQFEMSYVAVSILAGGNVRVGLEDNLWVEKCKIATNAQLVEIATTIILYPGARIIGPVEVREKLKLVKKASV